ncbi:transcription termination factor Rho [Parafannyhessea umbonata]|uniref:Transcription termination factor Rho n=1 Tax=Parafannyhessea umbonata TaxID=604330 RepID=A0A6N7WWE2_9ACTN|nr:transcription termination factor Rho [Parafannyhessea umbonata]MDD6566741.1 transcription termination factor Rho [Parafannyhessea umbonata]MDY4014364.1 transcription termination factor Rho [Parafannyhessea umbonata]MST61205.1 transcription termination factor Rho [Parafannyhessea umbonata]
MEEDNQPTSMPAPQEGEAAAQPVEEKPRRRRRVTKKAAEEDVQPTANSEEAAQAPEGEKPKRTTRRRAAKKTPEGEQQKAADESNGQAAEGDAPEAEKKPARRRGRPRKAESQQAQAEGAQAEAQGEGEAPKPRRRGRRPKAAEDAAEPKAEAAPQQEPLPVAAGLLGAPATTLAEADAAAHADAHADEARAAREGADQASAEAKPAARDAGEKDARDEREDDREEHGGRRRRRHNGRSEAGSGGNGNAGRDNNQRQGRNQRRRNRKGNQREQNVEPTLSRDDVAQMKVAELRKKAAELGIDYVGLRKKDLAESVYEAAALAEGFRPVEGVLEFQNEGYAYVRTGNYMAGDSDAFVHQQMIRQFGLRPGDRVKGSVAPAKAGNKYPPLHTIETINGRAPEEMKSRPRFRDLTPIYPNERLVMEHGKDSITGRAIDLVAPIGKGQRGLIVSPPKAGKTTVLKKICQSIAANNPEVHLFCLLVDERPEEVTDMERSIRGEVVASTFDMPASNHTSVSELVIEHAKRLVEMGEDVVVVLDSITRLARAYNLAAPASGRILSGGVDSAALYPPKKFLGAARNIENGGSLTILASALVDTGSKMDEVIFEEFKGTGNMELKLDRDLADRRIFPAIDPIASGTRNEDLLIDPSLQPFIWGIRRLLANMNSTERAATALVRGLKATKDNEEFLIRSAKKAQQTEFVGV